MKKILTGIKPTSDNLHIWNYFGAIKPVLEFQKDENYQTFMFLANMHTLTNLHDADKLRNNTLKTVRTYLACGIDPKKTMIYNPAKIPAHAELSWILSCITNVGFMKRMHAYKDAVAKNKEENTTVGTFCYPILMAADILLYDVDLVPVGKDQKQHVEYARDIAWKFNNKFWQVFHLPDSLIKEDLATIPGIDGRKMSKSYNNYIGLFDHDDLLLKKVKSISTMSVWIDEPKDPDKCNIYAMLKLFITQEEDKQIRERYLQWGLSFKEVKDYLYEKIVEFISSIREKSQNISDKEVIRVIEEWTESVSSIANKKIQKIKKNVWFDL